jgi:mannosyltransferase
VNAQVRAREAEAQFLLLAIILLGYGLRLVAIGQKSLWLDEAFSVWLAWRRLPEMWGWIARIDQHPPLYYTLLHLWMRLGDSAEAVRLLSVLLSTLNIPVIFLLGRRLAGARVGLLVALVLAMSPFHVRFAQEARMYALLTLCASMAMLSLVDLLTATRPRGRSWIGYVVFTTAAMLTHSAAMLLPVATNLFVLGWIWRRARGSASPRSQAARDRSEFAPPLLRSWLLAQAGVLLLWGAIWLPAFVGQAFGVYREFWLPMPSWRSLVDLLGNFLSAHLPRQQMPWIDTIWIFYAVLLGLGIVSLRRRPAVLALLLTLFLAPVIGELLVSLRRPVFYDRTLIWATIPLYILLAVGMARLRRWLWILLAAGILIAASGVSLREYYAHFQREGWKEAAAYVSQQARAGDLILFNATWTQIPFDFYYRDAGAPVEEHGLPVDLFDRGILEPKMAPEDLPRLRAIIQNRERVWLVYGHNWYTDPQNLIPKALSQTLRSVEQRAFEGLEIRLYEGAHAD